MQSAPGGISSPLVRAFAVIEPLADRGSIPVRRDPAAPFPNKTIYRLFLEKHREFI